MAIRFLQALTFITATKRSLLGMDMLFTFPISVLTRASPDDRACTEAMTVWTDTII